MLSHLVLTWLLTIFAIWPAFLIACAVLGDLLSGKSLEEIKLLSPKDKDL